MLRQLYRVLRTKQWAAAVELICDAKVPVLRFVCEGAVHVDVSAGGDDGSKTPRVTELAYESRWPDCAVCARTNSNFLVCFACSY